MFSMATLAFVACPQGHREWYERRVPAAMRFESMDELGECCLVLIMSTLHINCNEWLHGLGQLDLRAWRLTAVLAGHPDCARAFHMLGEGLPTNDHFVCPAAADRGHLDSLRFLHEAGFPWAESTTEAAAGAPDVACLKYARENGCPWTSQVTYYAAGKGNIACLRYAHENGCAWHPRTCTVAALGGHLNCLRYAAENGAVMDQEVCLAAIQNGHWECVEYALTKVHFGPADRPRAHLELVLDTVRTMLERLRRYHPGFFRDGNDGRGDDGNLRDR